MLRFILVILNLMLISSCLYAEPLVLQKKKTTAPQHNAQWRCYLPNKRYAPVIALHHETQIMTKINIHMQSSICLDPNNMTINKERIISTSLLIGIPREYYEIKNEYQLSFSKDDFSKLRRRHIDMLDEFKQVTFYMEDDTEWRIEKKGDSYVSKGLSREIPLNSGFNSRTQQLYFFSLAKDKWDFNALQVDFKHHCLWSSWPSLSQVDVGDYKSCKGIPSI
jgi:uncharacterized protein YneR